MYATVAILAANDSSDCHWSEGMGTRVRCSMRRLGFPVQPALGLLIRVSTPSLKKTLRQRGSMLLIAFVNGHLIAGLAL